MSQKLHPVALMNSEWDSRCGTIPLRREQAQRKKTRKDGPPDYLLFGGVAG
jgi:hypothetical protein